MCLDFHKIAFVCKVCVCPCPQAINNYSHEMNQLTTAFGLLSANRTDGYGLRNIACRELLPGHINIW